MFVCGNPVAWQSKKQTEAVAMSSSEAEYTAMSDCSSKLITISQSVDELATLGIMAGQVSLSADKSEGVRVASGEASGQHECLQSCLQ